MIGRWLNNLKWALVLAIFAGPAIAYSSYQDQQRIQRVMANGAEITAFVAGGAEERGRRGRRSYSLDLVWPDANGAPQSHTVDVSDAYAQSIIVGDTITIETTQIKYLASETDGPVVVVADASEQLETAQFGIWLGIGGGIGGLILAPLWFWIESRNKKRQDEDIDAELARMRGGQAPSQAQP
ncbi:MAG TPA: hypothetical protein VEF55_08180 [Candidatus Binatia bacterium]|nr:hypothetical protein [Candidatus Binatia bacterium]